MLTVDFDRLGLLPGERLLDLGSGGGRHAFEAMRRGARVTALDYSAADLKDVAAVMGAMIEGNEAREIETRLTLIVVKEQDKWEIVAFQNTKISKVPAAGQAAARLAT